jgi:hypothetical protein
VHGLFAVVSRQILAAMVRSRIIFCLSGKDLSWAFGSDCGNDPSFTFPIHPISIEPNRPSQQSTEGYRNRVESEKTSDRRAGDRRGKRVLGDDNDTIKTSERTDASLRSFPHATLVQ